MLKRLTSIFILLFLFGTGVSRAEIPKLINYQGRITDAQGVSLTGSYSATFRIYDAATGGNLLWEETHSGVVVDKGLFNILLGSVTALNIAFDKPYFLEIKIGSEIMIPRQQITSSAYAMRAGKAEDADKFGSKSSSEYVLTGEITSAPAANKAVKLDSNAKLPVTALKVYDSGWFPISSNTTYTKTHNLGTTKVIVEVLIAQNSDGTGWCFKAGNQFSQGGNYQACICSLSTTQIRARTGVYFGNGMIDAIGSLITPNIGYMRIVMLALE